MTDFRQLEQAAPYRPDRLKADRLHFAHLDYRGIADAVKSHNRVTACAEAALLQFTTAHHHGPAHLPVQLHAHFWDEIEPWHGPPEVT